VCAHIYNNRGYHEWDLYKKKEVDGVLMIWWAGRFKKELSLMIVGRTVISIV
jgi:hypothetical protein